VNKAPSYLNCVVDLPLDVLVATRVFDGLVGALEKAVTAGDDAQQAAVHRLKTNSHSYCSRIVFFLGRSNSSLGKVKVNVINRFYESVLLQSGKRQASDNSNQWPVL
jgi:hypothetical protein